MQESEFRKFNTKLAGLSKCIATMNKFEDWINEVEWNQRFTMTMSTWLETEADANMRIFMGMPRANDLVPKIKKVAR